MTLKSHVDNIQSGDNVIIGLGDSFTQGVGAYPRELWSSFTKPVNMHNITGQLHTREMAKYNWVTQLRDNFFPNYKIMNLGVNGAGNRAAVKELYLNSLPAQVGNVFVILMSTGIERFDFLKNEQHTSGLENHHKWMTIWPTIASSRKNVSKIEEQYAKQIWSSSTSSVEYLLNVAEAQNFCRARGYKFFFGSAFDQNISKDILKNLLDYYNNYIDIVNWDNFIKPPDHISFMEYICSIEDNSKVKSNDLYSAVNYVNTLDSPLKYITPCFHWTQEGAYEVSKLVNTLINQKGIE